MGFYESDPLNEAPILESPAHQYGPTAGRGNFSLLEPLRPFLWAGYTWKAFPVPKASLLLANSPTGMLPFGQLEDRIVVAPGAWLVAFSGFSAQSAGFRFTIFDVGANDFCLSDGWDDNHSGAQDNTDTDPAIPHVLPDPYCVVSPGLLQVKIVNSANANNDCQLLIHFAVPNNVTPQGGNWQ